MTKKLLGFLKTETANLQDAGLFREEMPIASPQGATVKAGRELINLASSNYLGFANHQALRKAAKSAIDTFGVGVAAPRMRTGTQTIHADLEKAVSTFLGTEETILFASGYHANTGLFESLYGNRDYVFCDDRVHPSLADGIRLCRARVLSYRSGDLDHLEDRLKRSRAARFRTIATDGVFALDGTLADLEGISSLASKYNAMVVVDDSHGLGVLGQRGCGTPEHLGVRQEIDILTGTFSHALGTAGVGYASGPREVIGWLRQKSRPYLVSSAPAPPSTAAALRAIALLQEGPKARQELRERVIELRSGLREANLEITPSEHPIAAIKVGDAVRAQRMMDALYREGVYAVGFCHPIVPEGEACIRFQVSASHTKRHLKDALAAIERVSRRFRLV